MMKFTPELAAIHGYLCGDGYVIKNPNTQKHKYYMIGLRNTNMVLLKDFQNKFEKMFGIKPIITNEGRCKTGNKEIYQKLTKDYSFYSYEWKLPKLSKKNLSYWLRAFFDCESWVENQPRKSRLIGLDCCNQSGIISIQKELKRFNINSAVTKKKNRTIWSLKICGKENLQKFKEQINFNHPSKREKLIQAINSYVDYNWKIPSEKEELFEFICQKGKLRASRNEVKILSIKRNNLLKIKKALNKFKLKSRLLGPWTNSYGSEYYCLILKEQGGLLNDRTENRSSTTNQKN
ncbi:MAG: LAGLIDADG family homing endonuclease [Candidatus Woesearchaeota archaeon]